MELKEFLSNHFDKIVAETLFQELNSLRQDVNKLLGKPTVLIPEIAAALEASTHYAAVPEAEAPIPPTPVETQVVEEPAPPLTLGDPVEVAA